MKTAKQLANQMYGQRCLEHNKTASRCYGEHYVSGNRSRRSGYEGCKHKERCAWFLHRDEGWNDVYITFGSVKDFRKCDKVSK
jgi:hypothetical protein